MWRKNVQFFCSGHRVPAPVDAELTVEVDGVASGGRMRNIEFLCDLFDAQWLSQQNQDLELPGGQGFSQGRIAG